MINALELHQVSIALEKTPIVRQVSLALAAGNIGCLLGPSGCGKTTLLRGIAGFEPVTAGEIYVRGTCVSSLTQHVPVEQRTIGMVFQDYALFPHLTIAENIAFGLYNLKTGQARLRVAELAAMLQISELLETYPHKLSGGQQQRVAIARAMAPRPTILLLDEPFASLDVELREEIAREIRLVLKQDGITTILVSHNQLEAFAMADEIGVMRHGELLQWSNAFKLYHEPANAYVADFVGDGIFIPGRVDSPETINTELGMLRDQAQHGFSVGAEVQVLIRPDDVIHDDSSTKTARVEAKAFRGAEYLYTLSLDNGTRILSLIPSHHNHAVGEAIGIRVEMDHLVAFAGN
ncbi:MAG: ABC transporter ATP-binding protein [Pseudohongiellaceae bacterium]